ncbi:outer membrane protein [Methylobacterium persicinum]
MDPAFDIIRAKTDVYGTLRARLGYSFDRYLVYATFGLAGANARVLANYPDLGTGASSRRRPTSAISASPSARACNTPSPRTSRSASTTVTSTSAGAVASPSAACPASAR